LVKKRIALLGATGSIGSSTLEVVAAHPDRFELVLATAHHNADALFNLATRFQIPNLLLTGAPSNTTPDGVPNGVNVHYGEEALQTLLPTLDYDIAVNAISGSAGLVSTLFVLETGKPLALANKESLVMAGHLVRELQAKYGSLLLPVDSEHSALFQAIGSSPAQHIRAVHLTASGGAFRTLPLEAFDRITVAQALRHPNWDMGAKVTLDSATLFNKALEVMEAHWLFGLDWEQIKVVVHPQSVIHSLVEFVDGSFLAQLSKPDMKLPILYALSYPERIDSQLVKTDLCQLPALQFSEVETERYPLYYLGMEAAKAGGILPTVVNAANEAALKLFLEGKIPFTGIAPAVREAMSLVKPSAHPSLQTILEVNRSVYQSVLAKYL